MSVEINGPFKHKLLKFSNGTRAIGIQFQGDNASDIITYFNMFKKFDTRIEYKLNLCEKPRSQMFLFKGHGFLKSLYNKGWLVLYFGSRGNNFIDIISNQSFEQRVHGIPYNSIILRGDK